MTTPSLPSPAARAPVSPIPDGIVTVRDYEAAATARLDANARAYFDGGAADEVTLADNVQAWSRLRLQGRVLRPLAGGHTRIELLGRTLAHPVLLAPVAHQRMAHPDGELATVQAAAALEAGMVLSMQASSRLEDVARLAGPRVDRGPLWFQLYLQAVRDDALLLVRRAEAAGYEALVLTVDAPVSGARDRERRASFRLPQGVAPVNLIDLPERLPPTTRPGQSALFDGLLTQAPSWDDVAWLCRQTPLPVWLKGLTHPADVDLALDAGAAGVIVSNHGGRTLDTMPATADLLPAVVAAMRGRAPVLVDGGIRRGTDVLKALALGASAVMVGRPQVHALAVAGAHGVAHMLRLLRDELEIAMALTGVATVADIRPDCLWSPAR